MLTQTAPNLTYWIALLCRWELHTR